MGRYVDEQQSVLAAGGAPKSARVLMQDERACPAGDAVQMLVAPGSA
jgi:hypothetical protein